MKVIIQLILFVTIIVVSLKYSAFLVSSGPVAERKVRKPKIPSVKVLTLTATDYQVILSSRGTVTPRTQSILIAEVSGRIVRISDNFRKGGFVEKDDLLVQLDDRDFQQALIIAKAELTQAQLNLLEEQAQSKQALQEWKDLNLSGEVSALTLRKPYLANKKAALSAAKARFRQAQINLQRTHLRAPFAGRMASKAVDIGQFVTTRTELATIYAVDYVEIRVPLSDKQTSMVILPEAFRDAQQTLDLPKAVVRAKVANKTWQWHGRVVRSEGIIDTKSRQQFVVIQINDPYAHNVENRPPLKIGQFVHVEIYGKKLIDVFVIPRQAINRNKIMIINEHNRVNYQNIDEIWRDSEHVIVEQALKSGQRIAITALQHAVKGAEVNIISETP